MAGGRDGQGALGRLLPADIGEVDVVLRPDGEDLLQVLAHITVAALEGKDPNYVTRYFLKMTKMLDGEFDQ